MPPGDFDDREFHQRLHSCFAPLAPEQVEQVCRRRQRAKALLGEGYADALASARSVRVAMRTPERRDHLPRMHRRPAEPRPVALLIGVASCIPLALVLWWLQ